MRLFTREKNNKSIEIDFCFQLTSWMGTIVFPFGIRWWTTKGALGGFNFTLFIDVLCFSLNFDYYNFGE